jgi:hypothetical protein
LVDVFIRFVSRPTMVSARLRFTRRLYIRRKSFLENEMEGNCPSANLFTRDCPSRAHW